MKNNIISSTILAGCAAGALMLAGCAQQQQHGQYTEKPAPAAAPSAMSKSAPAAEPAHTSGGVVGYFPSGKAEGSGLMVEKMAPSEAVAGQPFDYTYKVSNLTDATLENVMVSDDVSANFATSDSDPKAATASGGKATWNLGTLAPKESKTITVKGMSATEGVVKTCGTATYIPVICQEIPIRKPGITLTKSEPADVSICDPIPVTLVVKNTGSTTLTGVQVADSLPPSLTSEGKSSLTFPVGKLAPGESKEIKFNATAANTGKFVNTAKATSDQNVSADASASTAVHQAILAVTCKATEQQYTGRKLEACYTVSNSGDAPAAGATLEVAIPAGLSVVSTTANGQVKGSSIVWDLGSVTSDAPQNVCATFSPSAAGTYTYVGNVKATCAAPVSTTCSSKVVGISAILLEKSDDPDPVAIGDTTTYTVKVTNQGNADDKNVAVTVTIAPELVPVSSSAGTIDGQTVTFPVVPTLASKAAVTYTIVAKGVSAGDGHTKFVLKSDVLKSPISAEESTTVY